MIAKKLQLTTIFLLITFSLFAQKPVLDEPLFFNADPSPHQWEEGGRVYMYCTYDVVGSSNETEWHVFSSSDLANWIDHGTALHLCDIPWATAKAWAPDAAYKDGKYYFFYPASRGQGKGMSTGVAVSDSPIGPFQVTSDTALLHRWHDPAVFKDDDSSYYLYSQLHVVKLGEDMVSLAEEPRDIEVLGHEIPKKKEAVWVFKRKEIYYWIISEGFNEFTYWTGDNPYGPFTYRGILMPSPGKGNNHPGIIKFKDKWILFYHSYFSWKHGERGARRICAEELHFNEDGTIQQVQMSKEGVVWD